MRVLPLIAGLLLLAACSRPVSNGNSWGDLGDGHYRNPVLAADYSDPDVIRVGDLYYMVASDFHFMGMQVLESDDLVNWRLISQIYRRFDLPGWEENAHYAGGSWAPSIRWHDGRFWVYFCTPDEGLFMSTAEDPAGPWSPLHCVKAIARWEDPCPFWDEDGQAYLGHSLKGAGPIILHKMSPDGRELLDEGVTIYTGPTAEGTKIHRFGDWYYLSIPEGGVRSGWQTVLRSKDIYGPYERRIVLETGSTTVNGPHQGAIVDTPFGEWWFLHFQQLDPLGRVVHLQPMRWEDGWPVIGEDYDGNGVGEPVAQWVKPKVRGRRRISFTSWLYRFRFLFFTFGERRTVIYPPVLPASSDEFSAPELGLQWQFNHNPVDSAWSLSSHPGFLALNALPAPSFEMARNTLSQKIMGFRGSYTARLDLTEMADGQFAGLACMGKENIRAGIFKMNGRKALFAGHSGERKYTGDVIWFRLSFDIRNNIFQFAWSADGKQFSDIGDPFEAHFGFWKGARIALYSYCTPNEEAIFTETAPAPRGTALFDDFSYLRLE